jgi:uncharacterized protein YjbI with pentapeptide repeats
MVHGMKRQVFLLVALTLGTGAIVLALSQWTSISTGLGERRWKTGPNEEVQPSKTLWDLLDLLIVPVILVGVTTLWTASQTKRDNRREDRRIAADQRAAEKVRQDATLNDYIEQMSDLMLNNNLSSSKPADAVRSVARTVTLTALRRLDGERRGEVVRFLQEARLIRTTGDSSVNLVGADLRDAFLAAADLSFANLGVANLEGAAPRRTDLRDAHLREANLTGAILAGADLRGADLRGTKLADADLGFADLTGADLTDADLRHANLTGAEGLPKNRG